MQTIAAEASEKGVNIYGAARDVPSKAVYGEAGNRVRMDDFKGDFVLAVFWSRYCVPCIRELESLNEFARQTKNDGIRVILISPKEEWQGGFADCFPSTGRRIWKLMLTTRAIWRRRSAFFPRR